MPKRTVKVTKTFRARTLVKNIAHEKRIKFLRESAIVGGVILVLVIVAQLAYPSDRALPFTKVADRGVGGLTKREAIDYLFQTYGSAKLTVSTVGKPIDTTVDKAGVLVDFQKAADAAARYPLWQRLIPFSLFYKATVINAKPEIKLDAQLADQFAKSVKQQCDKAAKEASVKVEGSKVVLQQAEDGYTCTETIIKRSLSDVRFSDGQAAVFVTPDVVRPKKTTASATGQLQQAEMIIGSGASVSVMGKITSLPKEAIANWIVFTNEPDKGKFGVAFNDASMRDYLKKLAADTNIAPSATDIHLLDGVETYREYGQLGRELDYTDAISKIKQALLQKKPTTVTTRMVTLQPPLNYLRNYSQSQHGLERLLADLVSEKGNYGIAVMELGGMGRSASVNGGKKYVTASTYKLFISYMVLKDLEGGRLKWDDVITDGLTVRQCFEEMIVRSANRCALAYKAKYGAGNVVQQMRQLGLSSVEHNSTWWATPNDLALYMKKLERGELLQGESRDFLLGLLKRQVWRLGIPKGISGVPIADKVGFLEDYIHDVAIVYSPRGTYVLSIMTKGGSYGGIADAARRIERYLISG